ncbi:MULTISPECIES: NYN domain-containing protein [unclassified Sphingomonas]|uniref:NYN domain-containing protein n=1 Tax=unclassified Sphingomonas TaxID=196159 RepID=UPI00226A50CC|nr:MULTISPECIES: NYN domain-containing protein [unclassified Sphingomonas]
MTDTTTRNVALLIDADNASAATLDPVLTVLAELGTVNVRRVYGNWSKPALKAWRDMSIRHGIEPQQQFDLTKGKNATDMKMTIDAMDLLFRGRIDGFGIMSSDSDFMPLATRIRQDGVPVYGFGTSRTPEGFRQACTRFIDVGALDETPAAMPLPPAIGGDRPAPAPARARGGKEIGPELLKLLIDAYNAVKRDERGYVSLTEMGQLAGNRSSFDARNYGFNRLSDLIETVPNFQTERREGGRVFVKRLR